ncbi:hypothetical protein PT974_01796 [Cladobotryum mycophilum]|uniref:Uncharacterized protein n=1 Tax=Cladobotryum mycophilum TaxID=491253 RepID=A0ABR0SWC1_9HYPO
MTSMNIYFKVNGGDPETDSLATLVEDSQSLHRELAWTAIDGSLAPPPPYDAHDMNRMTIQSYQPLSGGQMEQLRSFGVQFGERLSDNTWSCHVDPRDLAIVQNQYYIQVVDRFPPQQKTSPKDKRVSISNEIRGFTIDIKLRNGTDEAAAETMQKISARFGIPAATGIRTTTSQRMPPASTSGSIIIIITIIIILISNAGRFDRREIEAVNLTATMVFVDMPGLFDSNPFQLHGNTWRKMGKHILCMATHQSIRQTSRNLMARLIISSESSMENLSAKATATFKGAKGYTLHPNANGVLSAVV